MLAKQKIPKALREQVWIVHAGRVFERKCLTTWCNNNMTVFDFQCGHNIPESKKGKTDISNLVPICSRCNLSMGSQYTFTEWSLQSKAPPTEKPTIWKKIVSKLFGTMESGTKSSPKLTSPKGKRQKLHGALSVPLVSQVKLPTLSGTKKKEKK
jgi:hypothetical protein